MVPLRVAVHWPSKPFADAEQGATCTAQRARPAGAREPSATWRGYSRALLARLIPPLCEVEVPLGPEEELELDALLRQAREGARAAA